MITEFQRVYEPWQPRIDKIINSIIKPDSDVRKKLHIRRENLPTLGNESLEIARHLSYRRSPENDRLAVEWLGYGSKAFAAYFELARQPEKKQTITILDCPPVTWDGYGIIETGRLYATRWQEAYYLAMVMRDRESMDTLAKFPVELLRKSPTKNDEQEYLLMDAIQSFHFNRADYKEKILALRHRFEPKNADDWLLYITMGKYETLLSYTLESGMDFNQMLAKNLASHRKYYERNTPEDQAPVESWIAFEYLGMACMVHDRGEAVTVDSEYIPKFLIEGTYI